MHNDLAESVAARSLLYATDDGTFQAGSAEPWIAELVGALIVANNAATVIEIGGFQGYTSRRMVRALARLPRDTSYTCCDIDPERAAMVRDAVERVRSPKTHIEIVVADSHAWIPTLPDNSIDFAWIDGNHEKRHVAREIELLARKMAPGGIMAFHDCFGVCDLAAVVNGFGGYSLDLPRLGPAGGIGLIQRAR